MDDFVTSRGSDTVLRNVADKAIGDEIITQEEYGFIVTLVDKYRSEADRKIKQIDVLRGQVLQLQANERLIIDLISNLTSAAERSKAREEAEERLKNKDKVSE